MKGPWINSERQHITCSLGRGLQTGERLDIWMLLAAGLFWFICIIAGFLAESFFPKSSHYGLDFAVIYTPILPCFYILQREYRPKLEQFGVVQCQLWSKSCIFWTLVSIFLFSALRIPWVFIHLHRGLVNDESRQLCSHWPVFLFFGVLIGPLIEEFMFRGYLYLIFRQNWGGKLAALMVSAIFALLHGRSAPFIFLLSLMYIYLDNRGGSLLPSVAGHVIWNGTSLLLCGAHVAHL